MTADQLYQGVGMVVVWMGIASALIAVGIILFCAFLAVSGPVTDWVRKVRRKASKPYTGLTDQAAADVARKAKVEQRPAPSEEEDAQVQARILAILGSLTDEQKGALLSMLIQDRFPAWRHR